MIDTSKPIEFLDTDFTEWRQFHYIATLPSGSIVGWYLNEFGQEDIAWFDSDSEDIRNKPEPKRRPLNDDELMSLVGEKLRCLDDVSLVTDYSSGEVWIDEEWYDAANLMDSSWRRLDGRGLWVDE